MRILAATFSVLLLASTVAEALVQEPKSEGNGPQVAVQSDWKRVLTLYKRFQGGAERFDGLRTMSFDFTPGRFDEQDKEIFGNTRHVTYRIRPNADEQEVRSLRIETEVLVPGEGGETKVKVVSIVTAESTKVWSQSQDGSYVPVEAAELLAIAAFDAQGLGAQLDLILFPDHVDLRCQTSGMTTRDSKRYMSVEAEFHPRRKTPDPVRLYFNVDSTLIERMDLFDAGSHFRKATTFLERYKDYDGIKFPQYLRTVDRAGQPLGSWTFAQLRLNPKLAEGVFDKP